VKGSHLEFILKINVLILVIIYSTSSGKRQWNILSRYISIRQAILYIRIKYNINNTNIILSIIGLRVGLVLSSYINVKNKCRNMILYRKQVELSDYLHYIINKVKKISMLVLLRDINYGGRISRLCYLIPVLVQTIFIYMVYYIYYNISIISYKLIIISIIIINIEWPLVIVYEYIYLSNISIYNNLLYNVALLIFLEILLFIGFYWLYINNIIHSSYNSSINEIISYTIIDSINANSNELCLISIISNLLILLYVTLILQMVHKYIGISNDMNNHNSSSNASLLIVYIYNNVLILYNSIRSIVLSSKNILGTLILGISIILYSSINITCIIGHIYRLVLGISNDMNSNSNNSIDVLIILLIIKYSNRYISSNNNNIYINIYTLALLIKDIIKNKLYMHHFMKYMNKMINKSVIIGIKDIAFMNKLFKILSIYCNVWYISSSNNGIDIIKLQYIDDKNIRIIVDEKEITSNYNKIDIISDMDNIISITYNLYIDNKCVFSAYLYKASI